MSKILVARSILNSVLHRFIGFSQRSAMLEVLRGEEADFMADLILNLNNQIIEMPKTGDTEYLIEPLAYLHYFKGSVDAWITEKDVGDGSDDSSQYQAFGKITLTGDKRDAEFGYISIQELIENGVELDLYWEVKPLSECVK